MRAKLPPANVALLVRQFETTPFLDLLAQSSESYAAIDISTVDAILREAEKFAEAELQPLNDAGDSKGCRLNDQGRVETCEEHKAAWRSFREAGWLSLDMPGEYGGQGLPLALSLAVQEVFDRSCNAFGMMVVPVRSAVKLLSAWASDEIKQEWLGALASGRYAATICISEAGAGSDAPRISTKASKDEEGYWRLTGEKCWISFGDQDLTELVGHCVLARTDTAPGLSLFLVPSIIDGERNGLRVHRIEEKMGLHISPTCVLGFDGACAHLLGEEGRGLAQMFVMITNMRLSVGVQGVGIAHGAFDIAMRYAQERRQGGSGPVPKLICEHADVRRMLIDMACEIDTARGLGLAIAAMSEMASVTTGEEARRYTSLVQWMLPVFKTLGSRLAFQLSSEAMQVLGGAGYTREWPVEQAVRDARVLEIFEGTTGIQGLDLLHRRLWKEQQAGLQAFANLASAEITGLPPYLGRAFERALSNLTGTADDLVAMRDYDTFSAEAGADAFLNLAILCAQGWIAARIAKIEGDDPASGRLRASGERFLRRIGHRTDQARGETLLGAEALEDFEKFIP